jgi:hypothetical protein
MSFSRALFHSLILGGLIASSCAAVGWAQEVERLRPEEYPAVALVVRVESVALGPGIPQPVCVSVTQFGAPPGALMRFLGRAGLAVSPKDACYPPGRYPRGSMIFVQHIAREGTGRLRLSVLTTDDTLGPEDHFAKTLRFGTYEFRRGYKEKWNLVSYTVGGPQ